MQGSDFREIYATTSTENLPVIAVSEMVRCFIEARFFCFFAVLISQEKNYKTINRFNVQNVELDTSIKPIKCLKYSISIFHLEWYPSILSAIPTALALVYRRLSISSSFLWPFEVPIWIAHSRQPSLVLSWLFQQKWWSQIVEP